ncbi:MAG: hypothetical protein ACKVOR_01035 [Flavobacteriales bacterium]
MASTILKKAKRNAFRISPEFIIDAKGRKLRVVLAVKDFEHLLECADELEDIRLYDESKAVKGKTLTLEEYTVKRFGKKRV